jgi:hypothetical protein
MWAKIKSFLDIISLVKMIMTWLVAKENQQIGRNEKAHEVTMETAEAENRMRDVERPDDSAAARSLSEGKF